MVFVSQDADAYCIGAFRRKGATQKGIHEFEQAIDRFARGTIWEASKVTLAKEKACFISSPVKLMIDLNSTKMSAVLQSIYQMPSEPNAMENLHDILMCPPDQRVDVTALVDDVSSIREATTAQGQRYIADIKIRDESGPENRCECNFTVFLPKTPSSRSALEALADLARRREQVTFFALQCDSKDTNPSVRPDWDRSRWAHCSSGA